MTEEYRPTLSATLEISERSLEKLVAHVTERVALDAAQTTLETLEEDNRVAIQEVLDNVASDMNWSRHASDACSDYLDEHDFDEVFRNCIAANHDELVAAIVPDSVAEIRDQITRDVAAAVHDELAAKIDVAAHKAFLDACDLFRTELRLRDERTLRGRLARAWRWIAGR